MDQTLGDVKTLIREFWIGCQLFGFASQAADEFENRAREVGTAIMDESGSSQENVRCLPDDYVLGEKATTLFQELKDFARNCGVETSK